MASFIPDPVRRRLSRKGSIAAYFKKSLLRTRQAASTFEFAYQARIAVERIRFAIRQTDQFAANQPVLQEVGMQLLDALDRLETADRHFQESFRMGFCRSKALDSTNGRGEGPANGVAVNAKRPGKGW
ncbi:MAG: hypothetical protein WAM39_18055 [Bryobacteraceae bacterium]